MIAIVTSLLSILAYLAPFLIEAWQSGTPARVKEKRNEEVQQGRMDIVDGNIPAINSRVDELLSIQDQQSSNTGQFPSTEDAQKRLDAL